MKFEVAGEFNDGTLELVDEATGKRYFMRMEKDEDGLVVAVNLEECA